MGWETGSAKEIIVSFTFHKLPLDRWALCSHSSPLLSGRDSMWQTLEVSSGEWFALIGMERNGSESLLWSQIVHLLPFFILSNLVLGLSFAIPMKGSLERGKPTVQDAC